MHASTFYFVTFRKHSMGIVRTLFIIPSAIFLSKWSSFCVGTKLDSNENVWNSKESADTAI